MVHRLTVLLTALLAAVGISCERPASGDPSKPGGVRILFLHHSTGKNVWKGGVAEFLNAYNRAHGTNLQITERWYPAEPMGNYPYDYWNLWADPNGPAKDSKPGLQSLETLAANYDVIVFKHCYPVSAILADSECDPPSAGSKKQTLANFKLQYEALKARLRQFPKTKFVLWTGAVLTERSTNPANAQRAREFSEWVKGTWDEKGDNIFLWDFYSLETEGSLYMKDAYAADPTDSHPAPGFSQSVAPLLGQRLVDVVEGRGDSGSLTGR
jgi:hypothetical protein